MSERSESERSDRAANQSAPRSTIAPEAISASVTGSELNVAGDEATIKREVNRRSRRSFVIGGVAAVGAYGGWRWLKSRPDANGIPAPLRRAHEFNESLSQAYFRTARLAPEFPRERAAEPRINGGEGLSAGFDPNAWRLQVIGLDNPKQYAQYRDNIAYDTAMDNMNAGDDSSQRHENPDAKIAPGTSSSAPNTNDRTSAMEMREPGLLLTLDDIKRLPRVEMTTELKCIEGWSVIVNWAGARFADFADAFRPADLVRYASLVTPDGGYYVGMDIESALHPQTLLCYEMNSQPLSMEHGAPLRLVTPLKYGIKHIKRIGRIAFTDIRPADFWAERGYDWYSGH